MLWSHMSAQGPSRLFIFSTKANSEKFEEVLEYFMILRSEDLCNDDAVFQQASTSPDASKPVTKFIKEKAVNILPRPFNSTNQKPHWEFVGNCEKKTTSRNGIMRQRPPPQWRSSSVLKTGRLEVPCSNPGRVCRPRWSFPWFSPKFAQIRARIREKDTHPRRAHSL